MSQLLSLVKLISALEVLIKK